MKVTIFSIKLKTVVFYLFLLLIIFILIFSPKFSLCKTAINLHFSNDYIDFTFEGWKFDDVNHKNWHNSNVLFKSNLLRDFVNISSNINSSKIKEGIIWVKHIILPKNYISSPSTINDVDNLPKIKANLKNQIVAVSIYPNSILKLKDLNLIPLIGRFRISNSVDTLNNNVSEKIKKNCNDKDCISIVDNTEDKKKKSDNIGSKQVNKNRKEKERNDEYRYIEVINVITPNSIVIVESGTVVLEIDLNKNVRIANIDGKCVIKSHKLNKTLYLKPNYKIDIPYYGKISKASPIDSFWENSKLCIFNLYNQFGIDDFKSKLTNKEINITDASKSIELSMDSKSNLQNEE